MACLYCIPPPLHGVNSGLLATMLRTRMEAPTIRNMDAQTPSLTPKLTAKTVQIRRYDIVKIGEGDGPALVLAACRTIDPDDVGRALMGLAAQVENPQNGEPVCAWSVYRWLRGISVVPHYARRTLDAIVAAA